MAKTKQAKPTAPEGGIVQHVQSIVPILSSFSKVYQEETSPKVVMIDIFLAFVLFAGLLQIGYVALVGTFPFNSFLSGLLCTVGVFVLTTSLRVQVFNKDKTEFAGRTEQQAFAEYIMALVVLFVAVFNFIG